MLSTALGIQFNVNDLDAHYEVVGSSDNYSFQYNLGVGRDLADFEGEAIQKSVSLEGRYGFFDVRVYAISDIGVRSAFVETGINISPPKFDNTFTFNNLRVTNLPVRTDVGSANVHSPQFEGDKLEVKSEFINKNAQISWELIPPVGHANQGESIDSELLKDGLFEKFDITIENGTGAVVIPASVLDASPGLQNSISAEVPSEALSNYREFSLSLNESVFDDLNLDRTFGLRIVSHDSFGRTATGVLTGVNYESNIEGFNYSLRGSDVSFSWFSNDSDFNKVSIKKLGIPSSVELVDYKNLQANIDYFRDVLLANQWNFGFGNYQSGDMVTYNTPPQTGIFKCIQPHSSNKNRPPDNGDYWEFIREDKVLYDYSSFNITNNQYSDTQTWGLSYYYALQAHDGYGASDILNLSDDGLTKSGDLKGLTSEVKISNLRFRERKDDLIFDWNILDQDNNLVDLEQYRFALSTSDTPSILGISGSLFDSHTKDFLTGITQGENSRISSVDTDGNRTVIFDLPTTKLIDSYEYTREVNNEIYGTGGFASNFQIFDANGYYNSGDFVADFNKHIYKLNVDTMFSSSLIDNNPRPHYEEWSASETYYWNNFNNQFQYKGNIYKVEKPYAHLEGSFGPKSSNVKGVFDSRVNYFVGDFVISSDEQIFSYSSRARYIAGDIVLHYQTFYLCLRDQDANQSFIPGTDRTRWRVLSLFDEVPCSIYKVNVDISVGANSFDHSSPGNPGDRNVVNDYLYYCFDYDNWGRIPLIPVTRSAGNNGDVECDSNFLYVNVSDGNWGKIALHESDKVDDGSHSLCDIEPDYHFIEVYTSDGWKKAPLSHWDFNGFSPSMDVNNWTKQTPDNSEWFSLLFPAYKLDAYNWSADKTYTRGSLVLYDNDIWSGLITNVSTTPVQGEGFWTNIDAGGDDIYPSGYNQNDIVYHNNSLYYALEDNPSGGPLDAYIGSGEYVNSTFQESQWIPVWLRDDSYDDFVFGHIGIPESGKRSVGIEVGIIDKDGNVLNSEKIIGINQEPSILSNGFQVDTTGEVTKVKFNFNYAFSTQEKTTKVHLYRSSQENFEITGSDGRPYDSFPSFENLDSTLVKVTLGAADASFGDNVTQIVDEPPIQRVDGIDQPTGYFYKILPFDDFGSGDLYRVLNNTEDLQKVIVWPKTFNNQNPNGPTGPVFRTSKDDIPGPVINFSGDTAFENYFLNWLHPNSEIGSLDQVPNDLSHYEVWMGNSDADDKLELGSVNTFLKDEADLNKPLDFSNNSGYRRIEGDIPNYIEGFGAIPIEKQDPASGITNATKIFNVQANGIEVETSYFGKTNDTRYFWVRPVDFAGNKGPFTGQADLQPENNLLYIKGLRLNLGQASATDISDFEVRMTEKFANTISLVPNNPFSQVGTSDQIKWISHDLYFTGQKYRIDLGQTDATKPSGYIWWDKGATNYDFSESHPAGSQGQNPVNGFDDGDFIVARADLGVATPVYHSFANALIGTANIANAAIVDAKISDLKADKITAGTIDGHDIQVTQSAGNQGAVRTAGFIGIDHNVNQQGFLLSGDGSFAFQGGNNSLGFDNGELVLRGNIKQSSGDDYDFIDINASPGYFNYVERDDNQDGISEYIYTTNQNIVFTIKFRNTSIGLVDDIRIKAFILKDDGSEVSIGNLSNNWTPIASVNTEASSTAIGSGRFYYVSNSFSKSGSSSEVKLQLNIQGFDNAIKSISDGDGFIIYAKSAFSDLNKSAVVTRVIDGKVGNPGPGVGFKGPWEVSQSYVAEYADNDISRPVRADLVQDPASSDDFYICIQSHTSSGNSNGTQSGSAIKSLYTTSVGTLNTTYWKRFGASFESIATNLLLTEDAFVTRGLVMGKSGQSGFILSDGFASGLSVHHTQIGSQLFLNFYNLVLNGDFNNGNSNWKGAYVNFAFGEARFSDFVNAFPYFTGLIQDSVPLVAGTTYAVTIEVDNPRGTSWTFQLGMNGRNQPTYDASFFTGWRSDNGTVSFSVTPIYNNMAVYIYKDNLPGIDDFVVRSVDIRQKAPYSTAGFLLARDNYNNIYFDMGGPLKKLDGTEIGAGANSKISFDSLTGKIVLSGASFDGSINLKGTSISPTDFATWADNDVTFGKFLGGGFNNEVSASFLEGGTEYRSVASAIIGGAESKISGGFSIIGGGYNLEIRNNSYSSILGGYDNKITTNGDQYFHGANVLLGGQNNSIGGGLNDRPAGVNQAIICGDNNIITFDPVNRYYYGLRGLYVVSDWAYLIGGAFFGFGEEYNFEKKYDAGDLVYWSSANWSSLSSNTNMYDNQGAPVNLLFRRTSRTSQGSAPPIPGSSASTEGGTVQSYHMWETISRNSWPKAAHANGTPGWIANTWIAQTCLVSANGIDFEDGRFPIRRDLGGVYYVNLGGTTTNGGIWGYTVSNTQDRQFPNFWINFYSPLQAKDQDNNNNIVSINGWCWFSADSFGYGKSGNTNWFYSNSNSRWYYID
jgi:hypothetical protein